MAQPFRVGVRSNRTGEGRGHLLCKFIHPALDRAKIITCGRVYRQLSGSDTIREILRGVGAALASGRGGLDCG